MKENLQSLKEYHQLYQDGIILQEEFETKKRELLQLEENTKINQNETNNSQTPNSGTSFQDKYKTKTINSVNKKIN